MRSEHSLDLITTKQAAQNIASYWPLILRYGMLVSSDFAVSYIIAKKDIELLGAYSAYSALIGIAVGLLYSSIFPVVTFMGGAKGEADEAEKNNLSEDEIKAAYKKIQLVWRQGIIFAAILSVPAVAFGLTASPIFALFKQPDVVLQNSRSFLAYSTAGFAADIFYRLTARTVTGLGVKKSILAADTFDRILEIGLLYAFLNGRFGAPDLGIAGAGLAYTISKTITALLHTLYLFLSPRYKKYNLFKCDGSFFDKETFTKLVKTGLTDGVSSISSQISFMLTTMFCGQSGTSALVGVQVASLYHGFANFHGSAVLNASCVQIGKYTNMINDKENQFTLENKKIAVKNVQTYTRLLVGICCAISAVACGVAFLFSKQLAALLIEDNNANQKHLSTAITFLKIQGVLELNSAVGGSTSAILEALLDNRFLMMATLLLDLAVNPSAAAATHYGLHKDAAWVYSAAQIGSMLMTMVFMMRCYSKLKAVYQPTPQPDHSEENVTETTPLRLN